METRIQGIPCNVELVSFTKGYPAKIDAPAEFCYESQPDEYELLVCDRRGRPAPWLACKMTDEEEAAILEALLKEMKNEDHT